MIKRLSELMIVLSALAMLASSAQALVTDIFPGGNFQAAIDSLNAGDTLLVHGGTYNINTRIRFQTGDGGAVNNRVNIWAFEDPNGVMDTPIFNFSGMTAVWGSTAGRGIEISDGVDWIHFKGLTIQNARDNGLYSECDNCIFERMVTRWNGDSGMQLDGHSANNLILNSDSYENYDPSANGENADGFAIKFADLGPGNVVRGSRAWGNSDDGWDMWQSIVGAVLVEDSWAYDNGKIIQRFYDKELLEQNNMTPQNFGGDGNGFKLGQDAGPHALNRVVAWENAVRGIDSNGNGYGVFVTNSTVWNSNRNYDFDEPASEVTNVHVLTNNISFAGGSPDLFTGGFPPTTSVSDSYNSWNLPVSVTADDFLSLDDTIARGPRNRDGSLPISNFLRLAPGSDLIDAGIDVGLPFNGSAPDLGAFETDAIIYADADFDEDTDVDATDLALWNLYYGLETDADKSQGDADGDGDVDGKDFLIWQQQYTGTIVPLAAVPEPISFVLMACGAMLGLGRQWQT